MRRLWKGERRQIAVELFQRDEKVDMEIESAEYKIYDCRGEDDGLIEDGDAQVEDSRISTIFDTTQDDYARGKVYYVRFDVYVANSPKIVSDVVEIRII